MLLFQQVHHSRTENHSCHSISEGPSRISISLDKQSTARITMQAAAEMFQHLRRHVKTCVTHRAVKPSSDLASSSTDLNDEITASNLTDLDHFLRDISTTTFRQACPLLKKSGLFVK
jgi:hypothetical protein